MKKILIASNNTGKKKELVSMLGESFSVHTMNDLGIDHDTVEDKDTLKGNSYKKARELRDIVGDEYMVLADDSGLFINALDGEPGVKTARYAADHDDEANIAKVLEKLKGVKDRRAQFITGLWLIDYDGRGKYFEGVLDLEIADKPRGVNGFAYDPILEVDGKTLAERTNEEKNQISHRALAMEKLLKYMKS